jgi:hypothetical protein
MTYIYLILKNNIPIYVGKTKNPKIRLNHHKNRWGKDIEIEYLDLTNDWRFWEKHYISLFKSWNFKLENKNCGGGGPENGHWLGKISPMKDKKHSDSTKLKQRIAKLGIKQDKESIEKRKKLLCNKPITQEHKDKISKSNKGKPKPKDFGKKLSNQRKGNWIIPKHQIDACIKSHNKITLQFTLDGKFFKEYPSAKDAAMNVGVHEVNMRLHLGGKYKTCKGYIFKYKHNGK